MPSDVPITGDDALTPDRAGQLHPKKFARFPAALQPMIDAKTDQILLPYLGKVEYSQSVPIRELTRPRCGP